MYLHLSATERKLSKQSLIGRIRTNPDLCSIYARVWVLLGFKLLNIISGGEGQIQLSLLV